MAVVQATQAALTGMLTYGVRLGCDVV